MSAGISQVRFQTLSHGYIVNIYDGGVGPVEKKWYQHGLNALGCDS